jgi:dihydrodipicolinate synthase/N-acetylneuraminate lyase
MYTDRHPEWKGMFPALPTQFHEDLSLDLEATMAHVEAMVQAGVHGMVMLGSIGENVALLPDEKRAVMRATVEQVAGRIPVLSGVAEFTTAEASRYAKDLADLGADGLMVLPAMVYPADTREALAHFRGVAAASPLPILVYNNPRYGVDIRPETFRELAHIPTIRAIKEASGDPRRITELVNAVGDRFTLFAGLDPFVLESVMLGATATVFGLVAGFPKESLRMWDLAEAGRWEEARAIYRWFMPLLQLDDHPKLVQHMKLVSQACGYGTERVRLPRLPLEGDERARVVAILDEALRTRPILGE